jgi:hypothetical protein
MLAIGCIIPVVLMVGGAVGGAALGGTHDAVWGGIAGAVCGTIALGALLWAWGRIRVRRL